MRLVSSQQYIHFHKCYVANLYVSVPLDGRGNVYDVLGLFFEQHSDATVLHGVDKSYVMSLCELATRSDVIRIGDSFYKQSKGLLMNNTSHNGQCPIVRWWRYIDDIFVISMCPLDDILPLVNTICTDIQFTCESSVDDKMPFLDTMVTL